MEVRLRLMAALAALASTLGAQPLALHPGNPHYFLFRGKPAILVTSGEHYGAVINLDFDYVRYLDALKADGLNLTRAFTGVYVATPMSFGIANNTIAPARGRLIAPWARSTTPGAAGGGNKFDLDRWDPVYFARLKDFVQQAGKRGIVVELTLFCAYYRDEAWELSPLHARNNINGVGDVKRAGVLALSDSRLLAVQDAMVRKIVEELRPFANLYYEICNEPYAGKVSPEWEAHIAATIREADRGAHLIAQNISNGSTKVPSPDPVVSLFNFHYSHPPDSVAINYALNKAIGNDETGFDGTGDAAYRIQGWDFLLAGGALYNNLDFSFTVGHEDGTFAVAPGQPGGGSPALRKQLGILRRFVENHDFIRMAPASVVKAVSPAGASARALARDGRAYAIYLHHGAVRPGDRKLRYQVDSSARRTQITLDLPAGTYTGRWLDTKTGAVAQRERFSHGGGPRDLSSPRYSEDIALSLSGRPAKTGASAPRGKN